VASLKSLPSKEVDTVHLGGPSVAPREGALIMVGGIDAGRVLPIATGVVTTLGRAAECTFSFDDPGLSRVHAHLLVFGQEYVVQDADSRNGTFVNDVRITGSEPTKLHHGDRIRIGALTFNFLLVDSEEVAALNRVFDAAVRDGLTNIYNRKHLQERLASELSFARRAGSEVSLVMIDVDHFKRVNDTYGHLVGSRTLIETAKVIKNCVREIDIVIRYGGDEFVVLLVETDRAGAVKVGERIRQTMDESTFQVRDDLQLHLTCCIGIATFIEDAEGTAELIHLADKAMYRGKETTRNVVYTASAIR